MTFVNDGVLGELDATKILSYTKTLNDIYYESEDGEGQNGSPSFIVYKFGKSNISEI